MRLLILDNYDSFTYNLVHQVEQFTEDFEVHRNDAIGVEEVAQFDGILLSPGPGLPQDAGIMMQVIERYAASKSIFGVCLGLQGIAEHFGATLYNLEEVQHGVSTPCVVEDEEELLFHNVPSTFEIGHYHSWAVDPASLPTHLNITAKDSHGIVMGIRHRSLDVRGVQFHPESIMTSHGLQMIENWIKRKIER